MTKAEELYSAVGVRRGSRPSLTQQRNKIELAARSGFLPRPAPQRTGALLHSMCHQTEQITAPPRDAATPNNVRRAYVQRRCGRSYELGSKRQSENRAVQASEP